MATSAEIARGEAELELDDDDRVALSQRPRTRADCIKGPRPCPWVGCRHHRYLDVNPQTGTIKIHFPDLEPLEMKDSCALDLAARGPMNLEEIARSSNCTRERIRQLEARGIKAMDRAKRRLR